jgi:hypothetical protein
MIFEWRRSFSPVPASNPCLFSRLALLLTGLLLVYQLGVDILKDQGIIKTDYTKNVNWGKWTAQLPRANINGSVRSPGDKQIAVFLLAARSNHPRGRFVPGWRELGSISATCGRIAPQTDKPTAS